MIQFNLLPDVKLEYIRARYRKRLIMGLSFISSAVFLSILILLFLFVKVSQTKHMNNLSDDIAASLKEIQSTPDLNKILTIQNQLNSLPGLHDKKVVSSRVVDFLGQLTPQQATISELNLDFGLGEMSLKGNADSLVTVNKFADTLKFTTYKTSAQPIAEGKAFKNVVLKSFSIDTTASNPSQKVGYELSFSFETVKTSDGQQIADNIFAVNIAGDTANGVSPIQLIVPKIISTRSETEKPAQLFAPQPVDPETQTPEGGQ